jgi:hypothetical protein
MCYKLHFCVRASQTENCNLWVVNCIFVFVLAKLKIAIPIAPKARPPAAAASQAALPTAAAIQDGGSAASQDGRTLSKVVVSRERFETLASCGKQRLAKLRHSRVNAAIPAICYSRLEK